MKKNKHLGQATIMYDENGFMTKAEFTPALKLDVDEELASKIGLQVKDATDARTIQHNSDMVLASWFSEITEIELADREQYSVASTKVECEYHTNGMIKKCVIDYHFVARAEANA